MPRFFRVVARCMLLTGVTYNYAVNPVTVALGDNAQRTIATTGRVNVAAVVSITSGPVTRETTGSALEDGTYGDFGAGLYGTSTLGTVLSQIPLAVGLQPGWRIDLAGVTGGSLTIGLTADVIAQARNAPGAIVMTMDKSGLQIPTASGLIDGYNKAQVPTTTLTLVNGGTSLTSVLPTVFDTGGGPNVMIYDPSFSAANGGRVTITSGSQTIVSSASSTPWGGSVIVSADTTQGLRVNPGGATIFENYTVLFRLAASGGDVGELILVPAVVPEPSAIVLALAGLVTVAVVRRRFGPVAG